MASTLSEMGASESFEWRSDMTRHTVDFHWTPLAAVWRKDRRAGLVRRPQQERCRRPDISVNNYSPFEKQLLAYDWALSDNEHLTIGREGPGCHYKLGVI